MTGPYGVGNTAKTGRRYGEWRSFTTLVGAFVRMNARGRSGRSAYGRALSIILSYGLSASYLAWSLGRAFDEHAYVLITTTVTMYLAGFTVLSSYSLILLDAHEERILSQFPLSSRTVFLARATNLGLYVVLITAPFAVPLAAVHAQHSPSLLSSLHYLAVQYLAALWTTGMFILLYNALIARSARSTQLLSVVQIVLVFLLLFFYQSLPSFAAEQARVHAWISERWMLLLPSSWFASLHRALAGGGDAVAVSQLVALTGTLIVMAGLSRTRWMLLPDLSLAPEDRSKLRPLPTRWMPSLPGILRSTPAERAGADMASALYARDRTLRFQILPVLMMPIAVALYGAFSGELHSPFDGRLLTHASRLHIPVLIFFLFSARHIEQVAQKAVSPTSVWLLITQTRGTLRGFARGVYRSLAWRTQGPQAAALFAVSTITMGVLESTLQSLFLLVFAHLQSTVTHLLRPRIPFTALESRFASVQRFAQFFYVLPFVILALLLHVLFSDSPLEFLLMLIAVEVFSLAVHALSRSRSDVLLPA